MILYIIWEIIPCSILLILFWSTGKTHKDVVIGSAIPPNGGADDYLTDEEASGFFNNDFRYDSDEDNVILPGSYQTPSNFTTPYATSPSIIN